MKGIRADIRLFELGKAKSREHAKSLIMAGVVYINERRVEKPGETVSPEAELIVRENPVPYVSRGGLKLEKAIKHFDIKLEGRVAVDLGASTGGFTDCMLKNGASHVYSVDVGYGQFDWSLRNDPRVTLMERTNARNISNDWFVEAPSFASLDLSFISSKLILLPLFSVLATDGEVITLIKPQFEAGRGSVGKNGVVRDPSIHMEVIASSIESAMEMGYSVSGLTFSPITGPKGNIEFLLYLMKPAQTPICLIGEGSIKQVVESAHDSIKQ